MTCLKSLIVTFFLLLVAGCGQLKVKVEVLDPSYAHRVVDDGALQLIYFDLQRSGASGASRPVRDAADRIAESALKLAKAYDALAVAIPKEATVYAQSATDLRTSVAPGGFVRQGAANVEKPLNNAGSAALIAAVEEQWRYDQALTPRLRSALESIQELRRHYAQGSTTEVRQMERQARLVEARLTALSPAGAAAPSSAAATAKEAGVELRGLANVELKSLIGNGSLVGTEYAYVVAKAPEHYWAPSFNRAASTGSFGSSDFVIKMNSLGDFSVKGMRFDASSVAKVAAKVSTQALLLGVQMAGVPVASSGTPSTGDGAKLADASGQLAANDVLLAKRRAAMEGWRQAIREMASAVLAEDSTLRSVAPTWATDKGKVTVPIDTSFSALKPILGLEGVQ